MEKTLILQELKEVQQGLENQIRDFNDYRTVTSKAFEEVINQININSNGGGKRQTKIDEGIIELIDQQNLKIQNLSSIIDNFQFQ